MKPFLLVLFMGACLGLTACEELTDFGDNREEQVGKGEVDGTQYRIIKRTGSTFLGPGWSVSFYAEIGGKRFRCGGAEETPEDCKAAVERYLKDPKSKTGGGTH